MQPDGSSQWCPDGFSFAADRFDLSRCAEEVLFLALPIALLVLFGPLEIWRLSSKSKRSRESKKLLHAKVFTIAATIVLQAVRTGWLISTQRFGLETLVNLILLPTLLLAIGVHHVAFYKLRRSSTTLLFFWLSAFVVEGIKLRTTYSLDGFHTRPTIAALQATVLALYFVVFAVRSDIGVSMKEAN